MKIIMEKPQYLKDCISTISGLVQECIIEFKSDGIHIISMDLANVCMVICNVLESAFQKYESNDEKICINMQTLKDVLRKATNKDMLIMELGDKLKITLKAKVTREFNIALINVDDDKSVKIPNVEYDTILTMKSLELDDAIDSVGLVSEAVKIEYQDKKLLLWSDEVQNDVKVTINELKVEKELNCFSKFSIDYMKKIIEASKICDNVKIGLKQDFPLYAEYKVPDKIFISFYLAPRVDKND